MTLGSCHGVPISDACYPPAPRGNAVAVRLSMRRTLPPRPRQSRGYSTPVWQEMLGTVLLSGVGLPMFAACVLVLRGFSGHA
jgi:hypothetical protein